MSTREVGPADGTLHVHTYRDGVAQRIGHDLVLDVERWSASAEVADDGTVTAVRLEADGGSLRVLEGRNGLKALSDKDTRDIRESIDKKVLMRAPIRFVSTSVEAGPARLTVVGELTLVGTAKPATFTLERSPGGRVTGTLPVVQTTWAITPYKALMGALKVRDELEIVLDMQLPAG